MEREQAKRVIEALLYMTDHALTEIEISEVIDEKQPSVDEVREIIGEIRAKYDEAGSPLCVVGVAGGYQIATRSDMAPWVRRLYKERLTVRLSASALETLAIIAYKQPITRSEIEQIRGVEASGVMETLLERRLVKVVGRKETIGRPLLYGTTPEFLRPFGLKHLSELPDLQSYQLPPQNVEAGAELPFTGDQGAPSGEPPAGEEAPMPDETPVEASVAAESPEAPGEPTQEAPSEVH
jgi:segregation and condensation protein B